MEKKEMYELASRITSASLEDLETNHKDLTEDNAIYFYDKTRGGRSVIISQDGSYLAAGSAISFEKHLEEFRKGRRNN